MEPAGLPWPLESATHPGPGDFLGCWSTIHSNVIVHKYAGFKACAPGGAICFFLSFVVCLSRFVQPRGVLWAMAFRRRPHSFEAGGCFSALRVTRAGFGGGVRRDAST